MNISKDELHSKVVATLKQTFSEEEAIKSADYLVWAEASGVKTQGIVKLTGGAPFQNVVPEYDVKLDKDTKLSQVIDAGNHLSPFVSQLAVDAVITKAQEHGFGIVGMHNAQSSNGAQAYYVAQIAKQGLIGISAGRATASAAAFGGIDAVFGTDPIGFAFPTKDEPLVFDMATSAMTWFGLVLAKGRGETLPDNMAIDKNGDPTTDPGAAMDGALLSFDRSYKGSGLAMVVEILAGPLVGAAYAGFEGEWGNLFIAIDPELLVDAAKFKSDVSDLISKVKSARKASGVTAIRLPGENAQRLRKQVAESGMIDVEDALLEELGYL